MSTALFNLVIILAPVWLMLAYIIVEEFFE